MRKLYLFIALLIISISTKAQRNRWEQPQPVLKEQITKSNDTHDKVRLQLELARSILYRPGRGDEAIDSAVSYANLAEKLSREIDDKEGIVGAMVIKALAHLHEDKRDLGLKRANEALAFSQKVKCDNCIAECYLAIGQYYPTTNPEGLETRKLYNDKAIAIFRTQHNYRRLVSILIDNAEVNMLTNRKLEGIKLAFEALNINKTLGNKELHEIYLFIAQISHWMADYPTAIKYNLLAINTAKSVGDSTLKLCYIYTNTAYTFSSMGDDRQAITYSLLGMPIAKRYKDVGSVRMLSSILSKGYTRTNQFPKALRIMNESLKQAKNDHDRKEVLSDIVSNYDFAKQYDKADLFARELRGLVAKIPPNNYVDLRVSYGRLASHYMYIHDFKLAYNYADRYAHIVYQDRFGPGIKFIETVYYRLDSIKGDFRSAFNHYQLAQRAMDSVDNATKAYQVSVLQIENDMEKKKEEIEALNKQAMIKDNALKRNQLIQKMIIAGCFMLVIITLLIYSRYRLKQRSNALLLKQKSEIDLQNIKLQHLVDDKNQLLDEKDEFLQEKDELIKDKDLLIKEVNHRVKNNLQIVMSLLVSQSGYLQNKQAKDAILEGQNRVQSIALIHDQLFHTDNVTEVDLVAYVTELVHCLDYSINKDSHKIKINTDIDDIMLDVSQAIPVGIILNEAVTNALKYAFPDDRTGEIMVSVKEHAQRIEIRVSDDGVGLPSGSALEKFDSLGMTLIGGLVGQLGGRFDIINNNGLTVYVGFNRENSNASLVAASV